MSDRWNPNFINQLPLFEILSNAYDAGWRAKSVWPTLVEYNQQCPVSVCNYNGQPIQFIQQRHKSQDFDYGYEPSIYLRGEVLTRAENWHDFFNRLVWRTFPNIKATFNYWQYHLLKQRLPACTQRTPLENKLTHLDENGVMVVCRNPQLIELLRAQQWQALFWQQRDAVCSDMRFFIVGHALYEKALNPYVGMTGSALIFNQSDVFFAKSLSEQLQLVDKQVSEWLLCENNLAGIAKLMPVPILGVPGWWAANEELSFYENKNYFREKSVK